MLYILCNPTAGGGRAREVLKRLQAHLDARGLQAEVGFSEYHGHTPKLIAEAVARGHRRIFTLGGDGTISEAVNGLAAVGRLGDVALGFLPGGTGNDFTRNLGLPQDVLEAFDALHDGQEQRLDLWQANEQYFVNVFGLGLDTALDGWARRTKKVLRGMPAYIAALFLTLIGFRFPRIRLTVDGRVLERQITVLTASNGRYYGGGIDVAPPARLQDGRLHLVLIQKVWKPKVPLQLSKYIVGKHLTEVRECEYMTAQTVTLEADADQFCESDGELILRPPVTIRPAVERLLAMVPKSWNTQPEVG